MLFTKSAAQNKAASKAFFFHLLAKKQMWDMDPTLDRQVLKDLSLSEYLFDEPLNVMDTAQLIVFVRLAFQDSVTKEVFLTLLHER